MKRFIITYDCTNAIKEVSSCVVYEKGLKNKWFKDISTCHLNARDIVEALEVFKNMTGFEIK